MYLGPGQLMRERLRAVRHWPAWGYRRWLIAYIVGIVTVYGVAIAVAGAMVSLSVHDLILFGGLLLGSAGTVELTRRFGENAGFTSIAYDVHYDVKPPTGVRVDSADPEGHAVPASCPPVAGPQKGIQRCGDRALLRHCLAGLSHSRAQPQPVPYARLPRLALDARGGAGGYLPVGSEPDPSASGRQRL